MHHSSRFVIQAFAAIEDALTKLCVFAPNLAAGPWPEIRSKVSVSLEHLLPECHVRSKRGLAEGSGFVPTIKGNEWRKDFSVFRKPLWTVRIPQWDDPTSRARPMIRLHRHGKVSQPGWVNNHVIIHEGDHVYLLAPPEKAQALDRFFADLPPPKSPDPQLLGDFFVEGEITLGALAELYGLEISDDEKEIKIADYFTKRLSRQTSPGDRIAVGAVALVAHRVKDGHAATIGLQLAESEAMTLRNRIQSWFARLITK